MDELIEVLEEYNDVQFLVSLDYNSNDADLYSCEEWTDLYSELGEYDNNPLILDGDPDYHIWNMFAGSTYSAYAFIDHNMVLRYKFDMPNLYDFQYTYLPPLIDAMYGCTDINACNYDENVVYDDGTCEFEDQCDACSDIENQLDYIGILLADLILEVIQHMVYFHSINGYMIIKDNGGNLHMNLDILMNIMK